MKVYYDCRLLAVVPKSFTAEEGDQVSYNEAYFLNLSEDGVKEVVKLNTKQDISPAEGEEGILEVDVDITGRNKPRLMSFKPQKSS